MNFAFNTVFVGFAMAQASGHIHITGRNDVNDDHPERMIGAERKLAAA